MEKLASGGCAVVLRLLLFVLAAVGGYVLTVVAAFVFWSWTGASGPNPNPLLAVLFIIAPAVGLCSGLFAATYPGRRTRRSHAAEARRDIPAHGRREEPPEARRGYGAVQITIIILCVLLIGAILGATGFGTRMPSIPP